jgi:TetR/AcrR family transcriptional regulator, transcriptional repressor for nem operon
MRYKPGHKEESRARILAALGRGFRRHGLEGIGVDGLATEAGVTSGAFYAHFASKGEAFEAAAIAGMGELREGVELFQREHGAQWLEAFIDFYLGPKRTCSLDTACALPTFTPEVVRAAAPVRARFASELMRVVEQVALGLPQASSADREAQAWALLALLSGGVTLARAMSDDAHGDRAAAALRVAALAVARARI